MNGCSICLYLLDDLNDEFVAESIHLLLNVTGVRCPSKIEILYDAVSNFRSITSYSNNKMQRGRVAVDTKFHFLCERRKDLDGAS